MNASLHAAARRLTPVRALILAASVVLAGTVIAPDQSQAARRSPTGPRIDTIGVVSFNSFHDLNDWQAKQDAVNLVKRSNVDVIGWQEGEVFLDVYESLDAHGFESVTWRRGAREVPISYRASKFDLVSVDAHRAHFGAGRSTGTTYPYPSRWTTEVVLRHKASGELLTVFNAHVNHKTEDKDRRPGRILPKGNAPTAKVHIRQLASLIESSTTKWTVATGDFNFDYRYDRKYKVDGFMANEFPGVAIPSYQRLGMPNRGTHDKRLIDYVYLARHDNNRDAQFVGQNVITGMRSDHRPLLARIALHR